MHKRLDALGLVMKKGYDRIKPMENIADFHLLERIVKGVIDRLFAPWIG